jgi:hypothetical protein
MKKIAITLGILLVLSNGWWFYQLLDQGVSQSYRDQKIYELEETRKQLMSMLPHIAADLPKEKIVEIASGYSKTEEFEKDGCVWAGWIGLKFSPSGKLVSVSPAWNLGEPDPCFPPVKQQ